MAFDPRLPERSRRPKKQLSWLLVVAVLLIGGSAIVVIQRHRQDDSGTAAAAESPSNAPPTSTTPPAGTPPRTAGTPSAASTTAPPTTAGASSTTTPPPTKPPDAPTSAAGDLFATPLLHQYLASRVGNVTAALIDLETKTTALWRPGVAEDTASIVKVDILATLLRQHQGTGTTLPAAEQSLATAMIEQSDNDAATDLWDDAGQDAGIGAFNKLVPLKATKLGTDGYWGLTTTTAADQAKLVQTVTQSGRVLDAASRRYETGLMEQVETSERWGVSGGVPAGVSVALKNGWLPLESADWQINSIGWVDGRNRDYILAVLTNGDPSEAYGIQTIEGLSALVWAHVAR